MRWSNERCTQHGVQNTKSAFLKMSDNPKHSTQLSTKITWITSTLSSSTWSTQISLWNTNLLSITKGISTWITVQLPKWTTVCNLNWRWKGNVWWMWEGCQRWWRVSWERRWWKRESAVQHLTSIAKSLDSQVIHSANESTQPPSRVVNFGNMTPND